MPRFLHDQERIELSLYANLVQRWNERTNLVGDHPDTWHDILFLDAFWLAWTEAIAGGSHLVDVGAGAGAPTLPLLLLRSDLRATLVEPRRKRQAFLRTCIGTLQLATRVRLATQSVQPERPSIDGMPFDVALSRATFEPQRWLEIGTQLASRVLTLTTSPAPPPPEGWQCIVEHGYASSRGAERHLAVFVSGPQAMAQTPSDQHHQTV